MVLDKSLLVLIILQTIFLFVSIKYNFIIYYLIYYYTLGTLYHLQLRFRILGQHAYLSPNNVISYSNSTSRTIKGGLLEKLFFTSDITAYHELHHKYPNLPYRTCKDIFIKQIPKENINTFLKKRSTMIFNFYRSLA